MKLLSSFNVYVNITLIIETVFIVIETASYTNYNELIYATIFLEKRRSVIFIQQVKLEFLWVGSKSV